MIFRVHPIKILFPFDIFNYSTLFLYNHLIIYIYIIIRSTKNSKTAKIFANFRIKVATILKKSARSRKSTKKAKKIASLKSLTSLIINLYINLDDNVLSTNLIQSNDNIIIFLFF